MDKQFLEQLFEKQVNHIMSQMSGDALAREIESEVKVAFEWLDTLPLKSLVDRELIYDVMVRMLENSPYTAQLHEMVVRVIVMGIEADLHQETTLEQIVPKAEYDKIVTHLAQFETMRIEVIRAVLSSPIYSNLISDVLYHGIKDYLLSDNSITKKVPGMSSIMKMGAKTVNRAMPNIEATAEATVKKYIENNINRTLTLSERILNNSLDADNIRKVADHFWESVADKEFAKAADLVKEDDIHRGVEMGRDLWLEVRQAAYFKNLVRLLVDHVFDEYGDREVKSILVDLGLDELYVTKELQQTLPNVLSNELVKGYLEQRVRAQLRQFYQSPVVQEMLES